jgi:FlgO protein
MLGRDPHALASSPPASAILTGTYGVGEGSVFVSLKLIRGDNAQILSGADFVVWRSGDINNLLGG